ncbi:response regulator [Mucilaginibacter sp.]|jgi:CheY-like chemotaxis protein|uniref:response regulator n=1 Tax=Mucilaginibacter sp. TaxID=1882438 RepID=UPI0025FA1762|nr:response regulator [Mucilaginibacter sp.]
MAKVFLIDDNPLEHFIADRMLNKYARPLEILHSVDARLALDFLKEHSQDIVALPDLILLDLNMPHFSGGDFLKSFTLVENQLIKHVDIFILTSSISNSDRNFCKKFPFVKSYFVKPITQHIIQQIFSSQAL